MIPGVASSTMTGFVGTVSNIKVSMIIMVAWVIIVTIALVIIGVLSFRRWRRDYFLDGQSTSDGQSSSAADTDSELGSNLGTEMGMDSASSTGGLSNSGFEADDVPQGVSVHRPHQAPPASSASASTLDTMFDPSGDATRL